jgi:hypothetical protein
MMAKMFYTIEEVAEKLGKTEDEVKEMAKSGQIQEFRDRDRLMFKVDQIDLLAGGDDDHDDDDVHLSLDDSRGGSGIGLAESDLGMSDSREGTGISVFDTDHGGDDESEQTRADDDDDLGLESVGSGSGLLDLTRESDDTALGAELLEDAYSGDDNIEIPANASGLFEAASDNDTDTASDFAPRPGGASVPMVVEAYDGAGSGLSIGLLVGGMAALVIVLIVAIVGIGNATPAAAMTIAPSMMIWVGGLAGVTLLLGAVGWFIGRASE